MTIYDDMKTAGVEIDHHEIALYVPVNETTTAILKNHPEIRATTFTDNISKTPWYDIPFQYPRGANEQQEHPKWPPPGRKITRKAYRCGACAGVFHTQTNHWGDIYACDLCKASTRCVCVEPTPEGYARPIVPKINTRIHYYCFPNIAKLVQRAEWDALRERLTETNGRCFESFASTAERAENAIEAIALEMDFLTNNQWHTPTSTVFDWYEAVYPNQNYKAGYWLEITEEMRALRHNTIACGYCGYQRRAVARTHFHLGCLHAEHLKESELASLRWRRLDDTSAREPLTTEERAWLIPLYRSRQIHGPFGQAQRAEILSKFAKAEGTAHATTERDGMLWLLDRAIKLDNVIYYTHNGRFRFGWRTPLSTIEKEELKSRLDGFPFPYDMK